MIKKISVLLSVMILACCIHVYDVSAASVASNTVYLDDGYYIITNGTQESEVLTDFMLLSSTTTKNVSKTSKLYDSQDRLIAALTVYASFSINNGISVKCTKVAYDKTIYNDNWSFVSATTSKNNSSSSKASASASGIFKNNITGKKVTIPVTVYCTDTGTIS